MANTKYIFANWKMQVSSAAGIELGATIAKHPATAKVAVALFPTYTGIDSVVRTVSGTATKVGGQNCYFESKGAFTGEVSAEQLKESGCSYVLVGHSERRTKFGETDEMMNKKLIAALRAGLTPVLCVGETDAERTAGAWQQVVEKQLHAAFAGVTLSPEQGMLVAYEPVWAIGTGKACAVEDAVAAHALVKKILSETFGADRHFPVLYGGSVDPTNIASYLKQAEIDGALVGGASQKAETCIPLLERAAEAV